MKRVALGLIVFLITTSSLIEKSGPERLRFRNGTEISAAEKFQKEFLERINQLRSKGCNCGGTYMPPAPPVTWNLQLELAAFNHAEDMNTQKYFDHISKDGKTVKDRIIAAGYNFYGYRSFIIGENIALGQRSIKEVMDGWIGSAGHCKNLMKQEYREVGIARYNTYWVQEFGGREPFPPKKKRGLF